MPLLVTFDVLSFAEFLGLLKKRQCTGHLHVRTGTLSAHLFLEGGWLVGVDLGDRFTATPDDGRDALLEACCEMLDSQRGVAEFVASAVNGANGPRFDTDAVLDSARARLDEWRSLQAAIPTVELKPRLVTTLPAGTVTLDQNAWQLLLAIDGRRSVAAIARGLGVTAYELRRRLKALLDDGIIQLDAGLPRVPFDAEASRPDGTLSPPEESDDGVEAEAEDSSAEADVEQKGSRRRLRPWRRKRSVSERPEGSEAISESSRASR
jgi:hypothetical protein